MTLSSDTVNHARMIDSWKIQQHSFTPEQDHTFDTRDDKNERTTTGQWSYLWGHYDASFYYKSSHYRLTQTAINTRRSLIPRRPPDTQLLLASGLKGYKSFWNVPHEFAVMGGTRQFGESWHGCKWGEGALNETWPAVLIKVGQRWQIEMDYSNWLGWDCKVKARLLCL